LYLLEWISKEPLYLLLDKNDIDLVNECLFDQEVYVKRVDDPTWENTPVLLSEMEDNEFCNLNSFTSTIPENTYTEIKLENTQNARVYYGCKITSGMTCGYEATELTYPKESEDDNSLSVAIGGTLTQILDKIVEFLGDYEYF